MDPMEQEMERDSHPVVRQIARTVRYVDAMEQEKLTRLGGREIDAEHIRSESKVPVQQRSRQLGSK